MKRRLAAALMLFAPVVALAVGTPLPDTTVCALQGQTCEQSGCITVAPTAGGGDPVQICTQGTRPLPAGALVASGTTCWKYHKNYECRAPVQACTSAAISPDTCYYNGAVCTNHAYGLCSAWKVNYECAQPIQDCQPPGQAEQSGQAGVVMAAARRGLHNPLGAAEAGGQAPASSNCYSTGQTCLRKINGICAEWEQDYKCVDPPQDCNTNPECEKQSSVCDHRTQGVCDSWTQTYACQNTPTDCITDPSCTRTGQTCLSSDNGLCSDWKNTYTCQVSQKTCKQWDDKDGKQSPCPATPHVFTGRYKSCNEEALCGSVNPTSCCCDDSLKKTGSSLFGCSVEEVKLAGARRAGTAHFLEKCCSASLPLVGCVSHRSSYCVFQSVLGRVIQEQGREQLAAMAASGGGGSTNTSASVALYGSGAWTGPFAANGNQVWVWQWPTSCQAPASGSTVVPPAPGDDCPASRTQVWFAVCAAGTTCTAPSAAPPEVPSQVGLNVAKTSGWSRNHSVALSRNVVVSGTCTAAANPSCAFVLTAISANTASLQATVSWPLYRGKAAGWNPSQNAGTQWLIAGYSQPLSASPASDPSAIATPPVTPPDKISIEYAKTATAGTAASWTSQNIPAQVPASSPVELGSTGIKVYGACMGPGYQCKYHVVIPATATPKPWDAGTCDDSQAKDPDCSGLSLNEFELLDLSKMDLSQWLDTITPKAPDTSSQVAAVKSQAAAQQAQSEAAQKANAVTQSRATYDTSGRGQTVLKLSALSCQVGSDCEITAWATANWPNTTADAPGKGPNPVYNVKLDWGDGSAPVMLDYNDAATVRNKTVFEAHHTYASPGNYQVTANFYMKDAITDLPPPTPVPVPGLTLSGTPKPVGGYAYNYPTINIGSESARWGYSARGAPGDCALHHFNVDFTLTPKQARDVQTFMLNYVGVDDWITVSINGHLLFGAPVDGTSELSLDGGNVRYDAAGDMAACEQRAWRDYSPAIDARPFIHAGKNTIAITYVVGDKGGFDVKFNASAVKYPKCGDPTGAGLPVPGLQVLGGTIGSPPEPVSYSGNVLTFGNPADNSIGPGGSGCSVYTYDIPFDLTVDDLDKMTTFTLNNASYEDFMLVDVNGKHAFSGPGAYSGLSQSGSRLVYDPAGDSVACAGSTTRTAAPQVDLIPFLHQGGNDIKIKVGVFSKGSVYANFTAEEQNRLECTRSGEITQSAQAAVQAWKDTPPSNLLRQDTNGGAEQVPQLIP